MAGPDPGLSHVFKPFSATTEPILIIFGSYERIFVVDSDSLGDDTKFFISGAARPA